MSNAPLTRLQKAHMENAVAQFEDIIRNVESWQNAYADLFPLCAKELNKPKGELMEVLSIMESVNSGSQVGQ